MTTATHNSILDEVLGATTIPSYQGDGSEVVISTGQSEILDEYVPRISEPGNARYIPDQKLRTVAKGLSFGFADELEGFVQSLLNDGVSYEEARDEVRHKVADYAANNPGEALALEMAGAVLPTLLSVFGSPLAWGASIKNIFTIGRSIFKSGVKSSAKPIASTMHKGGLATGTYQVGISEEEGIKEGAVDFATGYPIGALFTGGFALAGHLFSGMATKILNMAKRDKIDAPVRAELAKWVEKTGLTEDEVIQKIARGEIMAENASLLYYIKAAVKDSGSAARKLEGSLEKRPMQTRTELYDAMQESLGKGKSSERLTRIWKQSDEGFTKAETAAYNKIFKGKNNIELDNSMTGILLEHIRRFSGGADTINKLFAGQPGKLVPFFKTAANGEIRLVRQPTLHDAEIIYRAIRNEKDRLWRTGETELYQVFKTNTAELKKALDDFAPNLQKVRQNAYNLRTSRQAYKDGKKLWNRSPEDVADYLDDIAGNKEALESLRAGLLVTLKGKDAPGILKNIANDDKNIHKVIQMVFPEESLDDIFLKAGIFKQASNTASKTPVGANSQTIPLYEAGKSVGAGAGGERGLSGGILNLVNMAVKFVTNRGIPPKEANELVRIVTSQNPELVKKALIDDNAMNTFLRLIDSAIYGTSKTVGEVAAKTRGTEAGQHYDPVRTSGIVGLLDILGGRLTGVQQ